MKVSKVTKSFKGYVQAMHHKPSDQTYVHCKQPSPETYLGSSYTSKIKYFNEKIVKGTIMQIEKAMINDRLRVSKLSEKFRIPTIDNFTVIYPGDLLFS